MQIVTCDVLVIGAGAGGFAAAITARLQGLDVRVVEKARHYGGTTALSGGWLWIPCSPHAQRAGIPDSFGAACAYLRHVCGDALDEAKLKAYLDAGPAMVEMMEARTQVRFVLGDRYPDYRADAPGATAGGRAICAAPFDGRALGTRLASLSPPVRELTLFGLKVGSGPDFKHFFNARRSLRSALYVAGRIVRHFADVVRFGRDVLLMNGNALVGRLAASAFDLGIPLWLGSPATSLERDASGAISGARVQRGGDEVQIKARLGTVLAAGGFANDPSLCREMYAHHPQPGEHYSLAAIGDSGDSWRMAQPFGAQFDRGDGDAGSWMPMSRVPLGQRTATFPHSFDRGKPGGILVDSTGRRFVNESNSYHDVVHAMIRRGIALGEAPRAYLVVDRAFVRRYGLGFAKPIPFSLGIHIRSGYIRSADSIEALAIKIGVDEGSLARTVKAWNREAPQGRDPEFHRGENVYNVHQGDSDRGINACVAPISLPPYYAVRIYPGDLGTFAGLRTDERARVLAQDGRPIPQLYAVGNDMASLFGGYYPGPGANLGPAMTFGYLCALDIAARAQHRTSEPVVTSA